MKKPIWALTGFLLLPNVGFSVPTTYSYSGLRYTVVSNEDPPPGSYATAMRVAGFITLQDAISPSTNTGTFFGDAPEVMAFSFSDGRFEYTKGQIIPFGAGFSFETDASGQVSQWRVNIFRELPAAGFSSAQFTSLSDCGASSACDSAMATAIVSGADAAQSFVPGTWTVTAVPEPRSVATFLAGIVLVACAFWRRNRK